MYDELLERPIPRRPVLRVMRVVDRVVAVVRSTPPVYWRSHWRGRSYPCLQLLTERCPWCAESPVRVHGYVAITTSVGGAARLLELPAAVVPDSLPLGAIIVATRRSARGPIVVQVTEEDRPFTMIGIDVVVRSLCRLYALPELEFSDGPGGEARGRWLLALDARVNAVGYTPARCTAEADT